MSHGRKLGVIGLGYVGLPVAVAFARTGAPVIGFDTDPKRVEELRSGHDRTLEVTQARAAVREARGRRRRERHGRIRGPVAHPGAEALADRELALEHLTSAANCPRRQYCCC